MFLPGLLALKRSGRVAGQRLETGRGAGQKRANAGEADGASAFEFFEDGVDGVFHLGVISVVLVRASLACKIPHASHENPWGGSRKR
ncbi:MAG: hypothetical protein C0504_03455 [Candidatus Solibacter sp.]|nr:hypothetical protein [Candidatus Solibacter sp.]